MPKIFEKIGCHSDDIGPRPLQYIYHEMKCNLAITRQNQLKFWSQKAKQGL